MIVDLNIDGKTVIIIGGGNEAQKRINSIIKQNCHIIVISKEVNIVLEELIKTKKIKLKKEKIQNTKFISEFKPDIIITTTDDVKLNQKIINAAKRKKILVYSSDNPEESDFSNPAIIDFERMIQIAIFTGGKSPAMARRIKEKSEKSLRKAISYEDIEKIKIQKIARKIAKEVIPTQKQRKACLSSIINDNEIDQLIKDRQIKKAENQAIAIVRKWE